MPAVHACRISQHGWVQERGNDDYPGGDKLGRDPIKLLLDVVQGCRLDTWVFCHLTGLTAKMMRQFKALLGALCHHNGPCRAHTLASCPCHGPHRAAGYPEHSAAVIVCRLQHGASAITDAA